jgi:pimeloyl-ACP methyl ester carboxylesterase
MVRSDVVEHPVEVEDTVVGPDGRRVGYLARGSVTGQPVLYLHGAPGSRREQNVSGIADAQLFALERLNHFAPLLYPDLLVSLALGDR